MECMTLIQKNLNSKMYKSISYKKVLADNLQVMDSSAISMARDNLIPMVVFSILEKNAFLSASLGKGSFTLISEEKMSLFDLNSIETKMKNTLDNLTSSFKGIRTGRASTGLVDNITVDAYGQKNEIKRFSNCQCSRVKNYKN